MLKNSLKTIDLASAISLVKEQPVNQLTLAELIAAYSATHLDQRELRLKKWLQAFGHLCAWDISSEQLELSAQAMVEHGYSPATSNRDLSSIGSVYRWATHPCFSTPSQVVHLVSAVRVLRGNTEHFHNHARRGNQL